MLDGLRGEDSIAELYRKEGIAQSLCYTWSKEFLEADKRRPCGRHRRCAGPSPRSPRLKECVADLTLESRLLKKA